MSDKPRAPWSHRSPDLSVELEIARPVREVRAWWLEFADDYRATDPREQPHRIVVKSRSNDGMVLDTYWKAPILGAFRIPETFRFRDDGWDVEIGLPMGLAQRDEFRLTERDERTLVKIDVWVWPRRALGRLARPGMIQYARRNYPRTWRTAAKLCERDAPRL